MEKLIKILDSNNIKYSYGKYVGHESIVIKKNKYKLEIFKDENVYVSDLQQGQYGFSKMGSTTLELIISDLKDYLNINLESKGE